MSVVSSETVALSAEPDVVTLRRRVRELAAQLGFSLVDQTKLVTAASELARNNLTYGGGGADVGRGTQWSADRAPALV